jgi:hypothetical protein
MVSRKGGTDDKGAKFLGAETVAGIGRNQAKLDPSLDYGVDFVINSCDKPSSEIRKDFFAQCRKRCSASRDPGSRANIRCLLSRPRACRHRRNRDGGICSDTHDIRRGRLG